MEGFKKIIYAPGGTIPARAVRYVFSRQDTTKTPSHLEGMGHILQECVDARRERIDQWWDAGVEDGGRQPGSNARVWRSLDVDKLADVKPAQKGAARHHQRGGPPPREERRGMTAILTISRRAGKPCKEGF
jgi:hypothetical protein